MSALSAEQRQRIEDSRRRALELRAQKNRVQPDVASSSSSVSHVSPNPNVSLSSPVSQNSKPSHSTQNGSQTKFFYNKQTSNQKESLNPSSTQKQSISQGYKRGTLCLISRDRFELQMDYHQQTIDLIRNIEGRQYDHKSKMWNFPLTQYSKVVSVLKSIPNVAVAELPKLVVDIFVKRSKNNLPEDVELSRIQSSLLATLKEFQKDGVRFAVAKGGRILIADDMGLGKTIQALAIADFYRQEWPLLIVCPSSMRFQWVEEIHRHLPNVHWQKVLVVTSGKESISRDAQIVVLSYDLMINFKEDLLRRKFGVVVMDESHHLKNRKTKRTQAATELLKRCTRCVLLSGTPVLSRPEELFCQLHALKPNIFSKFVEYGIRYCDGKQEKFGWNFSGSSNMTELRLLLSEIVMIRRLKSEVLSQLPPKQREVVILEASNQKLGDTSEFAKLLQEQGLSGMKRHSTLLQYFHETGLAKIKGIKQYVQSMIENGEKFLIFAHHAGVLDAICEALDETNTDFIRIDGTTPSDTRKSMCNYFQENENCRVAVLSIKAANTGLTLTAAHLVIFAELYWNPSELTQGEDRVHRIGQEDSVLVQYLVQHGTADDIMWPLIQKKLNVLSKAGLSATDMDADTRVIKDHSRKDITDYFQSSDDAELAGIDFSEFEEDFVPPEPKKAKSG